MLSPATIELYFIPLAIPSLPSYSSYNQGLRLFLFPLCLFFLIVLRPVNPSSRHCTLNIEPSLRPPLCLQLLIRHGLVNLLHRHQLLYSHDLTGNVGGNGVEDGLHAAAETEGFEHALGSFGETNAGTEEGYAEVGHGD